MMAHLFIKIENTSYESNAAHPQEISPCDTQVSAAPSGTSLRIAHAAIFPCEHRLSEVALAGHVVSDTNSA